MNIFDKAVHVTEVCTYCNLKYGVTHNNKHKDMWDMYASFEKIFDKWLKMVHDFNDGAKGINEDHVGYITEWLNADENQDFIKETMMEEPNRSTKTVFMSDLIKSISIEGALDYEGKYDTLSEKIFNEFDSSFMLHGEKYIPVTHIIDEGKINALFKRESDNRYFKAEFYNNTQNSLYSYRPLEIKGVIAKKKLVYTW